MKKSSLNTIEPFLILTTTSDQALANRICAALEDANVPVMLEHVQVPEEDYLVSGYRLLAPSHYRETAMRIVEFNITIQQTRNLVTSRTTYYNDGSI